MTDSAQENLNSKRLARNIRHRLADMLGNQWTGLLDAAMDEMLLDEIDKFSIIQIPIQDDVPLSIDGKSKEKPITPFITKTGKDLDPETWARLESVARAERAMKSGTTDWPLRERPEGGNPNRKRDEDGDPYLIGIDKD